MDGAETHEMTNMNGTLEKGRKNTGFEGDEEEETTPIINDSVSRVPTMTTLPDRNGTVPIFCVFMNTLQQFKTSTL